MSLIKYLKEVKAEMKQIRWPTHKSAMYFTIAVAVISIISAIYLGALDFAFTEIVNRFLI